MEGMYGEVALLYGCIAYILYTKGQTDRQTHTHTQARQFSCCCRRHHNSSPANLWPHNSPDLNPVDDRIWSWMQEREYKTPVRDTSDLKQRLTDTWASIPQRALSTKSLTSGEYGCVHGGGGQVPRGRHFEHRVENEGG